jgi:hypothetical protein
MPGADGDVGTFFAFGDDLEEHPWAPRLSTGVTFNLHILETASGHPGSALTQ